MTEGADSLFEVGKLYAERCDFKAAEGYFVKALEEYLTNKQYEGYLKANNALLRIYAEMENIKAIDELKERLQVLVIKEKISLDAKTYYSLGLCASYRGQHKTALEFLEKSLAVALANDDKENICFAINGIAIIYTTLNRFEDALKEIYNLKVFFQVLPLPELKLSCDILNGHILREMGKYDQALEIFNKCYEELREQKNLYIFINLLYAMGVTYLDAGQKDLARMYLTLAKRSADPENLKFSVKKIEKRLAKLGEVKSSDYDLMFDSVNKQIVEKDKGRVDFKNQFILLDLLKMFVKTPGEVYSKEAIVEKIWKQSYDPSVHDNKLYVTIKRLRKMIEPDYEKPKYIFRAKNGYYLNKNARVLFQK
ncbi:MAG: tetratricopeptide repeat protein [Bdellovibrionales bacterium]|nr:tetratricopeptide repeat protein [Bdellovibrionales bacterium]